MRSSLYIVTGIAVLLNVQGLALGQITLVSQTPAQSTEQARPGSENIKINEEKMKRNKEIIKAIFERSLNERNTTLLADLIAPEYTAPNGEHGPAGFKKTFEGLIKSIPDIQWNFTALAADDDQVFASWRIIGTNTGPYQNFPATGKTVTSTGMGIFTLRDGKVISSVVLTDRLGFLQAVGILPVDLKTLQNRITEPPKNKD